MAACLKKLLGKSILIIKIAKFFVIPEENRLLIGKNSCLNRQKYLLKYHFLGIFVSTLDLI